MLHHFRSSEYIKWDGSLESSFSAESLLDAMTEDIMRDGNIELALQRAFRWGSPASGGKGLNDLVQRLRQQRQELLDQFDFGSTIDGLQEELDAIVEQEAATIQKRLGALDANTDLTQADSEAIRDLLERQLLDVETLPSGTTRQIEALQHHAFVDQDAGKAFENLVARLQQQVMDAMFGNLMGGMPNPEDGSTDEMREFLEDLNQAFRDEAEGRQPDMDKLNNRWAQQLGGRANSMNEIRERLRQRMEAMGSMMGLLTPAQRKDLMDLMSKAIEDSGLADQFAQLQAHIGPLQPSFQQQSPFHGDRDIPLDLAMQVLERANQMEQLEGSLRAVHQPGELEGIDPELLESVLDEADREWLDQWSRIDDRMIDEGYFTSGDRGLELTPRAVRKIGEKALEEIFSTLRNQGIGEHDVQRQGAAGELVETSRRWRFGDPFALDLPRTVMNAVTSNGPGTPVRLAPDHFEVQEREARTSTATVLLIDMSRSMLHNGCWDAAKRSALALDTLIRSKYPRDMLELIGFSATAHPLRMVDLPTLEWNEYNYGTNLQHALELARETLRPERGRSRQIIVITDGEPTAHLEDGDVQFHYPPTRETFERTLREVVRCTREDITINTFLLESNPHMVRFVEDLMKVNRGRVIQSSPGRLGNFVLKDFLRGRTSRSGSTWESWT